jgi:hypothetical protein
MKKIDDINGLKPGHMYVVVYNNGEWAEEPFHVTEKCQKQVFCFVKFKMKPKTYKALRLTYAVVATPDDTVVIRDVDEVFGLED